MHIQRRCRRLQQTAGGRTITESTGSSGPGLAVSDAGVCAVRYGRIDEEAKVSG